MRRNHFSRFQKLSMKTKIVSMSRLLMYSTFKIILLWIEQMKTFYGDQFFLPPNKNETALLIIAKK